VPDPDDSLFNWPGRTPNVLTLLLEDMIITFSWTNWPWPNDPWQLKE